MRVMRSATQLSTTAVRGISPHHLGRHILYPFSQRRRSHGRIRLLAWGVPTAILVCMVCPAVLLAVSQDARSQRRGVARGIHSEGRVTIINGLVVSLGNVSSMLAGF